MDEEIYHLNRVGAPRVHRRLTNKGWFHFPGPNLLVSPNKRRPDGNPWIRQETIRKKMELEHGSKVIHPDLVISNQGKYLITDPGSCRKRSQGSVTVD